MYASIEALSSRCTQSTKTLTLKRLPVYTRVNGIPLYAHSNIGLFSTRESHPFAHRHAGDSRRWVAIEPTNRAIQPRRRSWMVNLQAGKLRGTVAMSLQARERRSTKEK